MLNSLYIKNYRNLNELTIPSLANINLITGKNNTGKTNILEAIFTYAVNADPIIVIDNFLTRKGEYSKAQNNTKANTENTYINILSSIFTDRKIDFDDPQNTMVIGEFNSPNNKPLHVRLVKYKEETVVGKRVVSQKNTSASIANIFPFSNTGIGIEIKGRNGEYIFSLEEYFTPSYSHHSFFVKNRTQCIFVRTSNYLGLNAHLFDRIALTEKEKYVIDALKIIEPATERIAFRGDSSNRSAVIKLTNVPNPLPLQSMGDGINRILHIILGLINAENGFFLLDEFENGLHYTAQEKLWEMIFMLSQKLNVQVFATTHSRDCIESFENVLNNQNITKGKLIRLDNIGGKIEQVEFEPNELKIATQNAIEIR